MVAGFELGFLIVVVVVAVACNSNRSGFDQAVVVAGSCMLV